MKLAVVIAITALQSKAELIDFLRVATVDIRKARPSAKAIPVSSFNSRDTKVERFFA